MWSSLYESYNFSQRLKLFQTKKLRRKVGDKNRILHFFDCRLTSLPSSFVTCYSQPPSPPPLETRRMGWGLVTLVTEGDNGQRESPVCWDT